MCARRREFFILTKDKSSVPVKAIVVPKIASSLDDSHRKTLKSLSYLKDLDLAHLPTGKDTLSIEMLIGADFFWSFVGSEAPIRGEGPTAIKSRLGYLVSGPLQGVQVNNENAVSSFGVMAVEEDDISRLWMLESIGIQPQYETSREVADYAKNCITYQDNRYVNHPELPSKFKMVQNMTRAIIRRLSRDPQLFQIFGNLITQQLDNNFIEQVPRSQLDRQYPYIPYHYVKKESSTTPIRIVYNCSRKGWNGVSFNDFVETGAALQNDEIYIMLRFRAHNIGFVADVEKAFHHIELHTVDRD